MIFTLCITNYHNYKFTKIKQKILKNKIKNKECSTVILTKAYVSLWASGKKLYLATLKTA